MPQEHLSPLRPKRPYEVLGLSEEEQKAGLVDQEKFEEIINASDTLFHEVTRSSNRYGDFLFVTLSRKGERERVFGTFFGLGYHKYRERWITDEWFWFQTTGHTSMHNQKVARDAFDEKLEESRQKIKPKIQTHTQTARGKLFELLASLTDDETALAGIKQIDLFIIAYHLQNEPCPKNEED